MKAQDRDSMQAAISALLQIIILRLSKTTLVRRDQMIQTIPASRSAMLDEGSAKYSRSYKSRIAWSERDLQTLRPRMAVFKMKINAVKNANQDLQNDYGDLVDENDHFRFVNRQLDADNQSLREEIQNLRAGAREAATRLDELYDVIDALRQTNGDPQNENADLRIEDGNLRNQIQGLWTENHQLRGDNNRLHDDIYNLRKQLRHAAGTEDEANRLREQVRDAADATGENNDLHEQLEDLDVELRDTYAHLNRANNEITRLQAIIDWLLQEGSDRASSHPTTPSQSTPRSSSASRSASSPDARDRSDGQITHPRQREIAQQSHKPHASLIVQILDVFVTAIDLFAESRPHPALRGSFVRRHHICVPTMATRKLLHDRTRSILWTTATHRIVQHSKYDSQHPLQSPIIPVSKPLGRFDRSTA